MDNITHGALGIAIGMLRRRDGGPENGGAPVTDTDKAVVWAAFLAAELPDIDIVFGSGPLDGFLWHRGPTHALVAAPVIAGIATLITRLIWRKARVGLVYLWSLAAVLIAHLLNDWMTGWGTRLLWPFTDARLGLDWVPIVDYLYTPPLLFALYLAWRKPHLRRKAIASILIYLTVYTFGYRGVAHSIVERNAERTYAGEPVHNLRVSPDLFNALLWRVTVDLPDRFEGGKAYPFGAITVTDTFPKLPEDEVIRAVRSAPELKPFFDQFAYVWIQYKPVADGYHVVMGDVRYRMAGRNMNFTVMLDQNLKVRSVTEGGDDLPTHGGDIPR